MMNFTPAVQLLCCFDESHLGAVLDLLEKVSKLFLYFKNQIFFDKSHVGALLKLLGKVSKYYHYSNLEKSLNITFIPVNRVGNLTSLQWSMVDD